MWRILNIDWYEEGLLDHKARAIVSVFFGGMVPLKIYWMLERKEYRRIIQGFTLEA